jgi:hypothetical protein
MKCWVGFVDEGAFSGKNESNLADARGLEYLPATQDAVSRVLSVDRGLSCRPIW